MQKPIYFVSKVLQGPEVRYQAIEKAAPTVVFSARRLRHYFQSFTVIVMTNLPICKVLQKSYVAGRMVDGWYNYQSSMCSMSLEALLKARFTLTS